MAAQQADHKRLRGDSESVSSAKKSKRIIDLSNLDDMVVLKIFVLANRPTLIRLLNRYWEKMVRKHQPLWEQLQTRVRVDDAFLKSTVWVLTAHTFPEFRMLVGPPFSKLYRICIMTENHEVLVSQDMYTWKQMESEKKVLEELRKHETKFIRTERTNTYWKVIGPHGGKEPKGRLMQTDGKTCNMYWGKISPPYPRYFYAIHPVYILDLVAYNRSRFGLTWRNYENNHMFFVGRLSENEREAFSAIDAKAQVSDDESKLEHLLCWPRER